VAQQARGAPPAGAGEGARRGDGRRRADPFGAAAGPRRPSGSAALSAGRTADNPPRRVLARGVRARSAARSRAPGRTSSRPDGRAREFAVSWARALLLVFGILALSGCGSSKSAQTTTEREPAAPPAVESIDEGVTIPPPGSVTPMCPDRPTQDRKSVVE